MSKLKKLSNEELMLLATQEFIEQLKSTVSSFQN